MIQVLLAPPGLPVEKVLLETFGYIVDQEIFTQEIFHLKFSLRLIFNIG